MEKRPCIMLVEPSFFGVNFVKEARLLGCWVVVLVSDPTHPQCYGYAEDYDDLLVCDIRDAESIYRAIVNSRYHHVDALLSATDYALATTAAAAQRLSIPCMDVMTARAVRNKDVVRRQMQRAGLPGVECRTVCHLQEALAAVDTIGLPVVIKPTNTASSQHVFFVDDQSALVTAMQQLTAFKTSYMGFAVREEYLIERYLDGPEFSMEIFLTHGQVVFAEMTEKLTSELPYFVEQYHVFPSSVRQEDKTAAVTLVTQTLQSIGFGDGPAHVEFRLTRQGPRIIEVNGRPGGDTITSDLIPGAYGLNIFRQTLRHALGWSVDFTVKHPGSCAVGYVCSPRDGFFQSIEHLDRVLRDPAVVRAEIQVRRGDRVRRPTSSDDRLGFVIVRMRTPQRAKQKIQQLLAQLTIVVTTESPSAL